MRNDAEAEPRGHIELERGEAMIHELAFLVKYMVTPKTHCYITP